MQRRASPQLGEPGDVGVLVAQPVRQEHRVGADGRRPGREADREASAARAADGQHLAVGDLHGRVSRQLVAPVAPQLLRGDATAPQQPADLRGAGVGGPAAVDHERAHPRAAEDEGCAQPGGPAADDDGVVRGAGRGTVRDAEVMGARSHGDDRREATAAYRSRRWRQPHPRDRGTPRPGRGEHAATSGIGRGPLRRRLMPGRRSGRAPREGRDLRPGRRGPGAAPGADAPSTSP